MSQTELSCKHLTCYIIKIQLENVQVGEKLASLKIEGPKSWNQRCILSQMSTHQSAVLVSPNLKQKNINFSWKEIMVSHPEVRF